MTKPKGKKPARDIKEFISQVRSVLYRYSKKDYDRWVRLVEEFETDGGMSKHEACVQAAKDFPVCKRLFRAYSGVIEGSDPNPESHPGLTSGQPEGDESEEMVCEDREQSYRENLDWAIEAAGRERNEGKPPETCPNHTAFFLYREARDNPKEFLAKFTTVMGRADDDLDEQRKAQKSGKRSIAEIEEMLSTLESGERE